MDLIIQRKEEQCSDDDITICRKEPTVKIKISIAGSYTYLTYPTLSLALLAIRMGGGCGSGVGSVGSELMTSIE